MAAATTPVKMVTATGVPVLALTFASRAGNSRSRAMLKKMRLCPYMKTMMTVGNATTAGTGHQRRRQRVMQRAQDQRQRLRAPGEVGGRHGADGGRRHSDIDDRAQDHRTTIPMDRSRPGFFASSAAVEMVSKP